MLGNCSRLFDNSETDRPMVVFAGSVSWPPMRGLSPLINELFGNFEQIADFRLVYILEVSISCGLEFVKALAQGLHVFFSDFHL